MTPGLSIMHDKKVLSINPVRLKWSNVSVVFFPEVTIDGLWG
jgi:hypothetical protein